MKLEIKYRKKNGKYNELRASLVAQLVKNSPAMQETWVSLWVGKILWRRERLSTPVFWLGEFHGLYMKESYMAQNSLELKLLSGSSPPFYEKQRTRSTEEKNGH